GVRREVRAVPLRQRFEHPPCTLAKLKDALRAIALEQRGARERGELAGGAAAREIHLEEARLGVQEPLRTKRVLERLRADPCDADAVELDADPRLEPRYDGFPASPRQRRCEHG